MLYAGCSSSPSPKVFDLITGKFPGKESPLLTVVEAMPVVLLNPILNLGKFLVLLFTYMFMFSTIPCLGLPLVFI